MKRVVVCLLFLLILLTSCAQIAEEKAQIQQKVEPAINDAMSITAKTVDESEIKKCTIPKTVPQFSHSTYYTGPLIDSHIHMPVASQIVSTIAIKSGFEDMPAYNDKLSIDYLACLFDSEGITNVFGFNVIPNLVIGPSVEKVKSNEKRYPGKFIHFYQPTPLPGLNPSPEKVDSILTDSQDLFEGYGEVKFSFHEVENFGIRDKEYLESYQLANKHNLTIMMHPGPNHKEDVIFLLEKHPNVNFLFHGGEIRNWIFEVLEKYDNAYYTVEVNTKIFGWSEDHAIRGPTKEEFLKYMKVNYEEALAQELDYWEARIMKQPDKFLWGTDRWYTWHFDEKVGAIIEEFGRDFIGNFDAEIQEKFAYKNAQRLMEE